MLDLFNFDNNKYSLDELLSKAENDDEPITEEYDNDVINSVETILKQFNGFKPFDVISIICIVIEHVADALGISRKELAGTIFKSIIENNKEE